MMRGSLSAWLLVSLLAGCSSGSGTLAPIGSVSGQTHVVGDLDPAQWPQDAYGFRGARVAGDSLVAALSFGGGCGDHRFHLVVSRWFLETVPPRAEALLAHLDLDDPCEALVETEVAFDLAPLRASYAEAYGTGPGSLILRIEGTEIPYDFVAARTCTDVLEEFQDELAAIQACASNDACGRTRTPVASTS